VVNELPCEGASAADVIEDNADEPALQPAP
jgi:hypothetical protein